MKEYTTVLIFTIFILEIVVAIMKLWINLNQ